MPGTLAELHREPVKYNLKTLRRLVKDLQPDLLCAEIHRFVVRVLNDQLRLMQRLASRPRAINSGAFGVICDGVCALTAWVCGPQARRARDEASRAMPDNILATVRGRAGRRVLVTVDCRRRHRLERALRHVPEVELVD